MAEEHEVIVIGAGTTGAAAAYHLVEAGARDVLCLEMGRSGEGRMASGSLPEGTPLLAGEEGEYQPEISGSAVFGGGARGPRTIKMTVTLPPYLFLDGFAGHHGWDGVKTYLDLAARGRDLQLELAGKVLPEPARQVKQLGSLMVCEADRVERLRAEHDQLQRLGCPCEWWGRDRVVAAHGKAANFAAGIWFAQDGRVDSTTYARALLGTAARSGALTLRENGARMVGATDLKDGLVEVRLSDGGILRAAKVLVATGAMHIDAHLAGILTPRYSFLAALPHRDPGPAGGMAGPDSPNFFTFGFSHDWCVDENFVRLSGEDHFSALKSPRAEERCGRLARWAQDKYPYLGTAADYPARYGTYGETADFLPLVGTMSDSSGVCYMVGCNAWGQASLSAAAAMAPPLLGYRDFTPEEERAARLFSIRRFSGRAVAGR